MTGSDQLLAVAHRHPEAARFLRERRVRFPSPRLDLPDAALVALAQRVHSEAICWALQDATDPDDPLVDALWTQATDHPWMAALYAYEYATVLAEERLKREFRALLGLEGHQP